MHRLSDFIAGPPARWKPQKRKWVVELRDYSERKGKIEVNTTLIVEHNEPLQAFNFDLPGAGWGDSPHTDSAVIADLDGETIVCFVELTGRVSDDADEAQRSPAERKLAQLDGVAKYFHPFGRSDDSVTTGDRHHDAFASGDDQLQLAPSKDHSVVGLVVASRQSSRIPTPPIQIGRTVVSRLFVQLSLAHKPPPTVELRTLLKGWLKARG